MIVWDYTSLLETVSDIVFWLRRELKISDKIWNRFDQIVWDYSSLIETVWDIVVWLRRLRAAPSLRGYQMSEFSWAEEYHRNIWGVLFLIMYFLLCIPPCTTILRSQTSESCQICSDCNANCVRFSFLIQIFLFAAKIKKICIPGLEDK